MSRFNKNDKIRVVLVLGVLLLLIALASFGATWAAAGQTTNSSDANPTSLDAPNATHPIYLPLIERQICSGTVPCPSGDAR